jgi:plastocyanin
VFLHKNIPDHTVVKCGKYQGQLCSSAPILERMKRLLSVAVLALAGCNNNTTTPPVSKACPSTISISGNSYTTTACELKVGTPITIQATTGHPLTGSGAGRNVLSVTANQEIAFTEAGTFNFACDFHGDKGMNGSITVIP